MIDKGKVTDIFFDLDHTLWDFEKNSAVTFQRILTPYRFDFSIETFMSAYTPINHAYWKLYRENSITTEELRFVRLEKTFEAIASPQTKTTIEALSEAYINQLSSQKFLFSGTQELLTYLQSKYRLHIITNGFENVQQKKMYHSGILEFFDVILTAEKAGLKKPNADIFVQALQMANTQAESALMIGDSYEADIAGALAVGMQAIHFNTHNEPTHQNCLMVDQLQSIHQDL